MTSVYPALDGRAFETLQGAFRGGLVRHGDPTYDEHRRVWNGSIDRHPALIARCAVMADVFRFNQNIPPS